MQRKYCTLYIQSEKCSKNIETSVFLVKRVVKMMKTICLFDVCRKNPGNYVVLVKPVAKILEIMRFK